jgi:Flp pilus assembly protein TadG
LQTSERGSAVAEFLFLLLPMILCIGSTAQVSWVSFAKSQLRVIAATSAFQASQPDSDQNQVVDEVRATALQRLNLSPAARLDTHSGFARVELQVDGWALLGFSLVAAPTMSVTGYAVQEN